jgi:hypothetical protein
MARRMKMLCRVEAWRLVAATDVAARSTDSKMNPGLASLEALLAAERARGHVANCAQMRAGLRRGFALQLEMRTWKMREEGVKSRDDLSAFPYRASHALDRA